MPLHTAILSSSLALLLVILAHRRAAMRAPPKTLPRPRTLVDDLAAWPSKHLKDSFGLEWHEFNAIYVALRMPATIRTSERDCVDGRTALLMMLAYLRGKSLLSLESQFGWHTPVVSRVKNHVVKWILHRWGWLLDVSTATHLLGREQLEAYERAIHAKSGISLIWGFVDGTLRPIAYPQQFQEASYTGWKHIHAVKYQIINIPSGLLFVNGPFDGNENDWSMWTSSRVRDWLAEASYRTDGSALFLYGDKGYYLDSHLIIPFKSLDVSAAQKQFNFAMSKYRITVEWAIGSVSVMFPRLNNKQQQKTGLSPVGREFLVACIMRNALSCVSGSTTSAYFGLDPPDLQDYFTDTV